MVRHDLGPSVDIGDIGVLALGKGDRLFIAAVIVGIDLHRRPSGSRHHRNRGVAENVVVIREGGPRRRGRHVRADRHPVFGAPEPLLEDLDAAGEQRVRRCRVASLGQRDRLVGSHLVAGVEIERRQVVGIDVVAQAEHRAGGDQVRRVARRVAVGWIAVAVDQGGGLNRVGDVALKAVLPVVVINHRIVRGCGKGDEHGQRIDCGGVDPGKTRELVILGERHVENLGRRRIGRDGTGERYENEQGHKPPAERREIHGTMWGEAGEAGTEKFHHRLVVRAL